MSTRTMIKHVYWTLPYEVRRWGFRLFDARSYRSLQRRRMPQFYPKSVLQFFDRHHCIFIHIPKCAGISVCKSLFSMAVFNHMCIRTYQKIYSREEFFTYFKFTFVRNPWDRLVSAFHYLKAGGFNDLDRQWAEAHLAGYADFDAFVRGWVNRRNIWTFLHFIPQYSFFCTRGLTPSVDFVGYFENLEEDFDLIRRRLGLDVPLLHLNPTAKRVRDYKVYYAQETRQIVADVYRDDIRLLGYTFDNATLGLQIQHRCGTGSADLRPARKTPDRGSTSFVGSSDRQTTVSMYPEQAREVHE